MLTKSKSILTSLDLKKQKNKNKGQQVSDDITDIKNYGMYLLLTQILTIRFNLYHTDALTLTINSGADRHWTRI